MSIGRLMQLSHYGLMGNIALSNKTMSVDNIFNRIKYDEENSVITFSVEESQGSYGEISFLIDAIADISGCEDKEDPEEYLNINIKLDNDTTIDIRILY